MSLFPRPSFCKRSINLFALVFGELRLFINPVDVVNGIFMYSWRAGFSWLSVISSHGMSQHQAKIYSDDGLSSVQHQAIIWTNAVFIVNWTIGNIFRLNVGNFHAGKEILSIACHFVWSIAPVSQNREVYYAFFKPSATIFVVCALHSNGLYVLIHVLQFKTCIM